MTREALGRLLTQYAGERNPHRQRARLVDLLDLYGREVMELKTVDTNAKPLSKGQVTAKLPNHERAAATKRKATEADNRSGRKAK